jgi:hypothetical protein
MLMAAIGGISPLAWTNMRAPIRIDGYASGSVRNVPLSSAVRLLREDLLLAFPALRGESVPDEAMVAITVRYEVVNIRTEEIEIPVQFLAVDIRDLTAALDGRALGVEMVPDNTEKSECLWRLARHRSGFMNGFYKGFLERIRRAADLEAAPDAEWLKILEEKDLSGVEPHELYQHMPSPAKRLDFQSAGLKLRLPQGKHVLEVSYSQRIFVDERGSGYFSGWPKKGFSGVDYLLYPALSWPLDPGFRLSVDVDIPEMPAKRLFLRTRRQPYVRSNLDLHEVPAGRSHLRRYHGEFAGFPADILTVLFWFDPKALRYASN